MDTNFDMNEHPHTRQNILTGDWVLVSPHRTKRPWQGKVESLPADNRPQHDAACYLCAGNERTDGSRNPDYTTNFAFTNDYSALLPDTPVGEISIDGLLKAESQSGICRVIAFSPRHDLTLAELDLAAIKGIIKLWAEEFKTLSENPSIKHIQIFENKGELMGCSNPHPHGQIWAQNSIPLEIHKETTNQKKYFQVNGRSLLTDYLKVELKEQKRIVFENDSFVVLVPFWAVWPYETMIISKRHVRSVLEFTEQEQGDLASALKNITVRYDNLFQVSFPYSAGMHQMPVNDGDHAEWHWHMHFYPPLLRSATIKKFMVGYEMLGNPQRDITPEAAAETLRNLSDIHYKSNNLS